jgi:hypothetical protein
MAQRILDRAAILRRYAMSKDGKYDLQNGGELIMISAELSKKLDAESHKKVPVL